MNPLINRSPDDARDHACPLLSVLNDDGTLKEVRCLVERCQLWESLVDNHLGRCTLPDRFVVLDLKRLDRLEAAIENLTNKRGETQ